MNFPCIVRSIFLIAALLILNNASANSNIYLMLDTIRSIIQGINDPSANNLRDQINSFEKKIDFSSPERVEECVKVGKNKLYKAINENIPKMGSTELTPWQKEVLEYVTENK